MMGRKAAIALGWSASLACAAGVAAQQPPPIGIDPPVLAAQPYVLDSAEQHRIQVSVLAKGFGRPFAIEFLPGGDLLIVERGAGLRLLRRATGDAHLEPEPLARFPAPGESQSSLGVQDIALHPDFARNRWLYFTYNEPAPGVGGTGPNQVPARLTVMRARLGTDSVSQVETLFRGEVAPALGSRIAFAPDHTFYLTTGGAYGDLAQDLASAYGKVLRLNDDGSIPQDNPFVGHAGRHPAIYSYGHRDHHGLLVDPASGTVLNAEHGMNGGDEVNLIRAGANYGWPLQTFSRQYDGTRSPHPPVAPGVELPLLLWAPSIAPSGLMIYRGDRFPAWKGNLFVGSARRGEINFTGGLERVVFGPEWGELRREMLLGELHQRVRDVAEGPDGLIYVLTDGPEHAVLRLEPAD